MYVQINRDSNYHQYYSTRVFKVKSYTLDMITLKDFDSDLVLTIPIIDVKCTGKFHGEEDYQTECEELEEVAKQARKVC